MRDRPAAVEHQVRHARITDLERIFRLIERARDGRPLPPEGADLLRELGHRVAVQTQWDATPADAMIALHARRSHASIACLAITVVGRPLFFAASESSS